MTDDELRATLAAIPDKRLLATKDEVRLSHQIASEIVDGIEMFLQNGDIDRARDTLGKLRLVIDEIFICAEAAAPEVRS